ncbi:MAG: hypothetical protein ACTHQE_15390 [Thermomicrobiales bacterium]
MKGEDGVSGPPEGYVQGFPRNPVRRVANRHMIATIVWEDRAERGDRNTMIEPWVDVRGDLDAINRGEGFCHHASGRIWINGRLYGTHTDRRTGTIFPISGDGLITITSAQHFAVRTFARYNGITPGAEYELECNKNISGEDIDVARRIWNIRIEGTRR